MSRIIFDAGDSNAWNPLCDTQIFSASTPDIRRFYPIVDIEVPVLLTSRVVAVYAISETMLPHWKSAGFLNHKIKTGITVGGNNDARFNGSHHVLLRQINVLTIPTTSYQGEYALTFSVRPWHEDIYLQFWEYTGVVEDSENDLIIEEVVRRILEIQLKLDEMSNFGN